MVAAAPFQGLRFDPEVVGDPASVTAPPYDVITPRAREAYEAASPYNVVHLVLGRGEGDHPTRYDEVGKLIESWREQGALLLDPVPALYLYEETYRLRGAVRVQRGVLANVALDDAGVWVIPHEHTMVGPVADRLRLLEATHANLSPVFGVYAGAGTAARTLEDVTDTEPSIDGVDEAGVRHRLWVVTDPERIAAWCERLAPHQVLIADGHHRYRTSLAYRAAMRAADPAHPDGPWDQLLMFLVDADLHGPSVLPIHRLLADLPGEELVAALADDFELTRLGGLADVEAALERLPREVVALGVYAPGLAGLLVARDPAALAGEMRLGRAPLDVEVLHGPVLGRRLGVTDFEHRVAYDSDLDRAAEHVDAGDYASLVVLRAVPFATVVDVARTGGTLPQKTTFFYPKPRDGLVLRPLDPHGDRP